jgi:hypothetical protein
MKVLACSNCELAAADKYWWLTAALIVVAFVAATVLLIRLRRAGNSQRVFGLVAVAILAVGVGLSLSTLGARIRVAVGGIRISCNSALTSAETTGVPSNAALDSGQLACREAGRRHLRSGLPADITVAGIGFLATLTGIAVSFGRPRAAAGPISYGSISRRNASRTMR